VQGISIATLASLRSNPGDFGCDANPFRRFGGKRRYRRCNGLEIMLGRLKDWRRVATRHDRCDKTFLSAVALTATVMFRL